MPFDLWKSNLGSNGSNEGRDQTKLSLLVERIANEAFRGSRSDGSISGHLLVGISKDVFDRLES